MTRIEKGIIESVKENGDYFFISIKNSWCFSLKKEYGIVPKEGDNITLHIVNVTEVRGVAINNRLVFYKTDEQLEQEHRDWCKNYEKEKLERFEKNKAQMDSDYEALPENFKKRIDRFRNNNPTFRIDYEEYELFCCKEALKIAATCKTASDVIVFYDLKWEDQLKAVPTLSDGHSGNTFGCACMLARLQLECSDKIYEMQGSLSPVVGSKAFGDIKQKADE